jgi:hypothetical protein
LRFRIFYMIVVTIITVGLNSFGGEIMSFPTGLIRKADQRINRYLDSGTEDTGRSAYLEDIEVQGLPAIDIIFKAALIRWNQGALDSGTRRRVDSALQFARKIAWATQPSDGNLVQEIKTEADQLLQYYSARSEGQNTLISIFSSLRLWTAGNFWFFLKYAKSTSDLVESADRLRQIIPVLDQDQLNSLAETIRRIRPYSLVQLSLLMDTGQLKESELVILFKLASDRFAKRQDPTLDDPIASYRYEAEGDNVFSPTFAKIARALHSDEVPVISAMNKARKYWERQENYTKKGTHMRFFDSLGNEKMDWLHSDTWVPKAFTGRQREYTVEDNVILVDFKVGRTCEDNLK